jgi:hypothetical protein
MRKKFRSIVVDGDKSWAWNFHAKGDYYECKTLKIWKDKKVVFEKDWSYQYGGPYKKSYSMTPGLISRFIKMYLKK